MTRLSQRVQAVPPSGIRRFFDIAATMNDVISLGIGEPDFVTPDVIREAGIRSIQQGYTAYTSNSGLLELRQALAAHLQRLYGVAYDPEHELLITVGVSEALQNAMLALIDPGDEVIIPEPCFVAYGPSVVFAGGTPVYVPTRVEDNFQVSAATIRAAITPRTKGILIGYPNNPTGAVISRERLLEIAALAAEHDLLVFSDEIYDRLVYGTTHTCVAALPGMRERTILLGGFSKAYAMTGWRLGWLAGPEPIVKLARVYQTHSAQSAASFTMAAGVAALNGPQECVKEMVAVYDQRRRMVLDAFEEIPGIECPPVEGAFYVFPRFTQTRKSSLEITQALIDEALVVGTPGSAFGPAGEGHVRFSIAERTQDLEKMLERMAKVVPTL